MSDVTLRMRKFGKKLLLSYQNWHPNEHAKKRTQLMYPLSMQFTSPELIGPRVVLVPMTKAHVEPLWVAGNQPEIWELAMNRMESERDMERYVFAALNEASAGTAWPYVTTLRDSGRVIGTTRFGNITPEHKRVEIGWTWITPEYQRTFVNTEAKYLMLTHAFETWGVNRVELKTDVLNEKSRNAMVRIGAKPEGILRQHVIRENGVVRDNIFFAIIKEEWPQVKENLEAMLKR